MDTYTSDTQRLIIPYDYIRRRESYEKFGCSVGSEREQLSMKVVTVKY